MGGLRSSIRKFVRLQALLRRIRNRAGIFAYKCGLLPKRYAARVERYIILKESAKVFNDKKTVWDDRGFWKLCPMPSEAQLGSYYRSQYWLSRGDQGILLRDRDLDHFVLLRRQLGELLSEDRRPRVLNFGAGHGGISHLLFAMGFRVTNIESSVMESTLGGQDWITRSALEEIEDDTEGFDLVYASHSLEHVADIDGLLERIERLSRPGGFLFFEVPNCRQTNIKASLNGGADGRIHPPHTYYFTVDLFRNLPFKHLMIKTFSETSSPNREANQEDGDVIRYLGKNVV